MMWFAPEAPCAPPRRRLLQAGMGGLAACAAPALAHLMFADMNCKRLAVLFEVLPARDHLVVFGAPQVCEHPDTVQLLLLAGGLLMLNHPMLHALRANMIAGAATLKLAVMYQWPSAVREGGLMVYGTDLTDMLGQLARLAFAPALLARADEVVGL